MYVYIKKLKFVIVCSYHYKKIRLIQTKQPTQQNQNNHVQVDRSRSGGVDLPRAT